MNNHILGGLALARVFYTLKASKFGLNEYSVQASLKNPAIVACFDKLSDSLQEWERSGIQVDVGDYFKSLLAVFGINMFPSHVLAECGLPIYLKYRTSQIRSEPPLTKRERLSFRERYIKETQHNYGWTRKQVEIRFAEMLPS